jgi:hypothetical protein
MESVFDGLPEEVRELTGDVIVAMHEFNRRSLAAMLDRVGKPDEDPDAPLSPRAQLAADSGTELAKALVRLIRAIKT